MEQLTWPSGKGELRPWPPDGAELAAGAAYVEDGAEYEDEAW